MTRSFVACLLALLTITTTRAQETPTLNLPHSYRQNVCDRHNKFYNGELPLRDALQGFELHSLLRSGLYLNLDDETGAIDEDDPGLIADILDELASRAGFTWRNSFGVTDGPAVNKTWTDLLEWAVENYDVSVDWWVPSSDRLKMGIGFPAGFVDASYILIAINEEDDDDVTRKRDLELWSLTKPFSRDLWIAIALTVFISAAIFCILEGLGTSSWKLGSSVYGTILVTLQHFQLHPKSRAGKLIGVSVALWSLIVIATYTANLTSFFVIQNTPESPIQSLDDAINAQLPMCVWEETSLHKFVRKNYGKGIYIPIRGAQQELFDGLREGKCALAVVSATEWKYAQINKNMNPDCNMEWIGRIINYQDAGFALKSDSGRLCTSLVQDVLNLHLVDMETDGKLGLLQEKHLKKSQDIDCVAVNAAANFGTDFENSGQLTLAALAGPFVVHAIATACAILIAAGTLFQQKCVQRNKNRGDDEISKTENETDRNGTDLLVSNGGGGQGSSLEAQLQELREALRAQSEKQDELARKQDQILALTRPSITNVQVDDRIDRDHPTRAIHLSPVNHRSLPPPRPPPPPVASPVRRNSAGLDSLRM